MAENLKQGISIIICCYNSANRLPATLQHLAAQQFTQAISWELVLVNNASTDQTEEVAIEVWQQQLQAPAPLRIINEPRPGTDHARRTGIYAAQYNYFVFCDDDNWLQSNYLQTGYHFLETQPQYALVGGQGIPVSNVELPVWFQSVAGYYAATCPRPQSADLTEYGLWGAGTMGRTALVRIALHPNYPLLNAGRVGANAGFGEDGEICWRVALAGGRIYYLDSLVYQHFISANRLTEKYRDQLLAGAPEAANLMTAYARMYCWHYATPLKKQSIFLKHWLQAYLLCPLKGAPISLFTKDYLYFKTGSSKFITNNNEPIANYVSFLKEQ